jgi:hypothetical protein
MLRELQLFYITGTYLRTEAPLVDKGKVTVDSSNNRLMCYVMRITGRAGLPR